MKEIINENGLEEAARKLANKENRAKIVQYIEEAQKHEKSAAQLIKAIINKL